MNTIELVKQQTLSKILVMSSASLIFAVLMGFSSLIRIPVPGTPVPLTLQTFILFSGAAILRRHYSLQMIAWYLLLGFCGAPFFTNGSGLNYIFGATGGYLIGFVFASAIIGYYASCRSSFLKSAVTFIAAAISIYFFGLVQLKLTTGLTWTDALKMGVYPFILFDIIKSAAALLLVRSLPLDRIR